MRMWRVFADRPINCDCKSGFVKGISAASDHDRLISGFDAVRV